ncbi:MAG: CAP domain-containing protein [Bacillota bacterium]
MKNRFIKITLTLVMLLVMAVPTQAFAAEKCDIQSNIIKNNNYSNIYQQLTKQSGKAVIPSQSTEQEKSAAQSIQVKQAPKAAPVKSAVPATTAAPAKSTAPTAAPAKSTAPTSANIGAYEQQVVDLVNKERAAAGLPALKVNTALANVAEKKAEDLRDKNYFAHQSPTYGSPFDMMKQFGISYSAAGENIAKGQRTPAEVMNGWMNSPGHKANILNSNFTEIGVGYVTDSNGAGYWVQHFIRP